MDFFFFLLFLLAELYKNFTPTRTYSLRQYPRVRASTSCFNSSFGPLLFHVTPARLTTMLLDFRAKEGIGRTGGSS
jgi:hypothetical protein